MKRKIRLSESDLRRVIKESVRRILKEGRVPSYEEPVFIECSSPEDADISVEIGYSSYDSSLFYVGGCGTDAHAALEMVVDYLEQNGLIDHYAYSEDELDAYDMDDFIEVEGYYIPSWNIHMNQIVGNYGERR